MDASYISTDAICNNAVKKDLADRKMMNRRFHLPYDDFISTQYDEYQSSLFHLSSNAAHNSDIYGRMYSDRIHLGEF